MSGDAPLITFRNPQITFLEKTLSLSGKYMAFLGVHYENGCPCWVVGTSNIGTGEIIMRHYNEKIPNCVAPQAQAYTYWEEFKSGMTENKHGYEYEETYLNDLQKYLN